MIVMSKGDKNFRTVWISHEAYRGLLEVKYALMKKNGKSRSPDDVVKELVEFWEKHKREK